MPVESPTCEQDGGLDPDRWLGVELRHLAALEAIARVGSFRGAADNLGYVQSAISQQIFHLESLVGTRLIERSRGSAPLALTHAGRLLLEHVAVILERLRAAEGEMTGLIAGRRGTLRIGAFHDVTTRLFPQVLPGFASLSPDVDVVPVETRTDEALFELVERGEVELAFCQRPLADGPFEHVDLVDDPFVLLVSAESPLAEAEDPPSLEEIAELPLIGFNQSRAQDHVMAVLADRGIEPELGLRSDLNATLQALVAADLGVAISPYLSVDPMQAGTTVLELPEIPPRTIALIWHRERERSEAAEQFTEAAVTACRRWFRHGHAGA